MQYITHLEAQERYQGSHAAAELDHDVERWLLQPFKLMIKEAKENLQQQQERVAASCARVSALMDNCKASALQAVSVLNNTIGGGSNSKFICLAYSASVSGAAASARGRYEGGRGGFSRQ